MTPLLFCLITLGTPEKTTIIRGATVYDGSGQPGVVQDISINGNKITAIGKIEAPANATIIDGKGLIVAPGFIEAGKIEFAIGGLDDFSVNLVLTVPLSVKLSGHAATVSDVAVGFQRQ